MNIFRTSLALARGIAALAVVALVLVVALLLRTNQTPHSTDGGIAGAAASPTAEATGPADPINLDPAVPPVPPAGECVTYDTTVDSLPLTAENLSLISSRVVAATVEEVGASRWRTASETAPTERHEFAGDSVMRLVRFSIDEDLGGDGATGSTVVWIPGGAIGCHKFLFEGYPVAIKAGERYALFLDDGQPPLKSLGGVARVMAMWQVTGDRATSPDEGSLTLSEIAAAASKGTP